MTKVFRPKFAMLLVSAGLVIILYYHVTTGRVQPLCTASPQSKVTRDRENFSAIEPTDPILEETSWKWVPPLSANNSRQAAIGGHPVYVMLHTAGRLGNRMFSYASLLAISRLQGFEPLKNPDELSSVFRVTSKVAKGSLANMTVFNENKCCTFDPRVLQLSPQHNWTIHGYFQSWKYFHPIRDVIRSEFRFKDDILKKVEAVFRDLGHYHRPKVGVHVRRGDMMNPPNVKRGYTTANASFFLHAMDFFRHRLTDPLFVIIGDDMAFAKRELSRPDVTFVNNSPVVDLAVLAHCNHVIMSTGTFGWWGAWLSGGTVVYYKNFPKPGSYMWKHTTMADFYPPWWIAME